MVTILSRTPRLSDFAFVHTAAYVEVEDVFRSESFGRTHDAETKMRRANRELEQVEETRTTGRPKPSANFKRSSGRAGGWLEEPRESRETVRAILNAATESMLLLDASGTVLALNQTTAKRLGKSADELIGRYIFDFLPPSVAAARRARLDEVVRSGQPAQFEDERQGMFFEHKLLPVFDERGKVVRVAVCGQEITERKHTQQRQAEALELNRAILATSTVGIMAYRATGQCVFANEAAGLIVGASVEQLLQQNFRQNPDWREHGLLQMAEEALRTRKMRRGEIHGATTFGKELWLDCQMVPFVSGGELHLLVLNCEITNQKRAEEVLRGFSRRLRRAQDEERRHLARGLHDSTAQKLAAVNMNLGRLKHLVAGTDPAVRNLVGDIAALVEDCSKEVRTLSYLLHPPLLDQLGLPAACRSYLEGFSKRSGVRVRLDVPDDLGRLPASAELALFRVLQEALANIQRHSGSKTASIRLTRAANRVVLKVSDRGRGISAAVLRDVAQGFGGPGLGLLSMRERVDQLGGRLEIESGTKGTTLVATLPLPVRH